MNTREMAMKSPDDFYEKTNPEHSKFITDTLALFQQNYQKLLRVDGATVSGSLLLFIACAYLQKKKMGVVLALAFSYQFRKLVDRDACHKKHIYLLNKLLSIYTWATERGPGSTYQDEIVMTLLSTIAPLVGESKKLLSWEPKFFSESAEIKQVFLSSLPSVAFRRILLNPPHGVELASLSTPNNPEGLYEHEIRSREVEEARFASELKAPRSKYIAVLQQAYALARMGLYGRRDQSLEEKSQAKSLLTSTPPKL